MIKSCQLFFCFILPLVCTTVRSQNFIKPNDTTVCLQLIGIAIEKEVPLNGVSVTLFRENEELEWDMVTNVNEHEHRFSFNLMGNAYYTIQVSKKGYVTRSIGVSTKLPDEIRITPENPKTIFEFEVELSKKNPKDDDFYIDFPVAMIKYDVAGGKFDYDTNYTKKIKEKMEKSKEPTKTNQQKTPPKK